MAARFGVGLGTVQRALARVDGRPVEDVDWADRSTAPHRTRRTDGAMEALVLATRQELAGGILGETGAVAIRQAPLERGVAGVPAVRPEVADHRAELDSFDAIVGLRLLGGAHLEVLTGVSLHGGLVAAWPTRAVISPFVVEALVGHWREVGLPGFAQFDNDTRFLGTHGHPDVLGPVPRVCLALGVTPVFAPIREPGFQAAVEGFNGLWRARVWKRAFVGDGDGLVALSDRYVLAHRARRAGRIEAAPARRPFPATMPAPRPGPPSGG